MSRGRWRDMVSDIRRGRTGSEYGKGEIDSKRYWAGKADWVGAGIRRNKGEGNRSWKMERLWVTFSFILWVRVRLCGKKLSVVCHLQYRDWRQGSRSSRCVSWLRDLSLCLSVSGENVHRVVSAKNKLLHVYGTHSGARGPIIESCNKSGLDANQSE